MRVAVVGMVKLRLYDVSEPSNRLNRLYRLENVRVAALDCLQQAGGRLAVEVDARDGGLGALEDDVLGLLHVQAAAAQMLEHVRQHAGTVAVPHDEHVRCRGLRARLTTLGTLPVSL